MSPAIARKTLGLLKTGFSITPGNTNPSVLSSREQDVLQQLVEGWSINRLRTNYLLALQLYTHTHCQYLSKASC